MTNEINDRLKGRFFYLKKFPKIHKKVLTIGIHLYIISSVRYSTEHGGKEMAKEMTREEMLKEIARLEKAIRNAKRNYAEHHKRVVEELPCADMTACKMFAEIYGFKYQAGNNFYKDLDDINFNARNKGGVFNYTLPEDKVAVAIPSGNGFILRIVRIVVC